MVEVRPSAEPGVTTRVSFDAGLPESYRRTVFVDPYTAEPRATLTPTPSGSRCAE